MKDQSAAKEYISMLIQTQAAINTIQRYANELMQREPESVDGMGLYEAKLLLVELTDIIDRIHKQGESSEGGKP